jgi:hypothetical protein
LFIVPVIWALASADVNAGTARAARIAIIAITTSNSISVNAEEGLFNFCFHLGFVFLSAVVLRVFSEGFCLGFHLGASFGGYVFWGFALVFYWGLFWGFGLS